MDYGGITSMMFKKFGNKDDVTMVRVSSPVGNGENVSYAFNRTKDFVENQLFDAMYNKSVADGVTTWEYISDKYGNGGMFIMVAMLLIPIGMVVIGIRRRE